MIQRMLAIWSLVPLPFLNPAWTSGSSWFMYCWSMAWRILSITLLLCAAAAAAKSLQSCPTLREPVDCSLPGSSVHGIFQAIVLEWIAISHSKGSSQPRDRTRVSCIVDRRFTAWATREIPHTSKVMLKILQARLQQYVNRELSDIQAGFRKGRGTRDQIANIRWIIKKSKTVPEKHLLLLYWLHQSLWLCGSPQTVENSLRD